MTVAVRPYATAGVALVGASVLAISPLAPPMPDVQAMQRTVSSIGVELSASVNPIDNWIQVFQTSTANLTAIGQQFADSPAPILSQVIKNQMTALKALQTAFDSNATTLRQILNSIPNELEKSRVMLEEGDITGAFSSFNNNVVIPLALSAVQAMSDLTRPAVATVNNFAKAFAAIPDAVFQVVLPMTFPLLSTINVVVQTAQDVYDGAAASDPAAILNTLVNFPANLANGFLNGSGQILGFINTPGLLTPYDPNLGFLASGPISSLLDLRDVIAQAIGAAPPAAAAAAAAKAPAAAKTVTLTTEAPKAVGAGAAADAPKADEPTAAEPDAAESSTGSTGSTTASTKATPAVTAAPAADSATGGSSSSDAKSGAGHDSKAGSAKKAGTAKSARAAKASK